MVHGRFRPYGKRFLYHGVPLNFVPPLRIVRGLTLWHSVLPERPHPNLDGVLNIGTYVTVFPKEIAEAFERAGMPWSFKPVTKGFDAAAATNERAYDIELSIEDLGAPIRLQAICADRTDVLLGRDALEGMLLCADEKNYAWSLGRAWLDRFLLGPFRPVLASC